MRETTVLSSPATTPLGWTVDTGSLPAMVDPRLLTLIAAILWLPAIPLAKSAPPAFTGAAACAGCHTAETQAWHGSQHDQAMQEASPETVLGDFADAKLTQYGVTSRFYRKGGDILCRDRRPGRRAA